MKLYKLSKVFVNKIFSKIRFFLYSKLRLPIDKPEAVYLNISNKCNFHCQMCDQWKQGQIEDPQTYLTIPQIKNLIDQLSKWGIKNFGISGGETMIFKTKVLELLNYANKKGMYSHFVTNGFLLDAHIIKEYDQMGGGHISLSLDAASELHDELRGKPGAYSGVKRAIKTFKDADPKNILLKINLVISDKNLDEIIKVVELCDKDHLSIFMQPYDPYNWNDRKTLSLEQYRKKYPLWISTKNQEKLSQIIKKLLKIKKRKPSLILNSTNHLKAIPPYFNLTLNRTYCSFGSRALSIAPNGDIILCRYGKMANIKDRPVHQTWKEQKFKRARKLASRCNYDCLLGCMYDPSTFSWIRSGLHLVLREVKK
ncbi:MAG: radical SAM protein [bacterium]